MGIGYKPKHDIVQVYKDKFGLRPVARKTLWQWIRDYVNGPPEPDHHRLIEQIQTQDALDKVIKSRPDRAKPEPWGKLPFAGWIISERVRMVTEQLNINNDEK